MRTNIAPSERSRQYPGMAPAAGPSPCIEPGYSTQERRHLYYIRGGFLRLRRLRRGKSSTGCPPQDNQPQPAFPAVLRGPDGALHASGYNRLQVRQQGNRRVNPADRRLLADQQELSFSRPSAESFTESRSHLRRPSVAITQRNGVLFRSRSMKVSTRSFSSRRRGRYTPSSAPSQA